MDDELLRRLQGADPARGDRPAASWINDLVEATMDETTTPMRGRRPWLMAGAAAAAVVAVGGGAFALLADDDPADKDAPAPVALELTLPATDPMMMCIQFSVDALRPMEKAFAGTATDVEGETVTLDVDRWYTGGDADVVTLQAGSPDVLLEGGITFTEGERYLVTATGDTVNTCGFSGPYTEELAAAFDEAF